MRRIALPLFVVGLVGLAGCGGGPSKSSFLATADETCRAANAPVASLQAPTSFPELSGGAAKLAAATDEQVPRLQGLDRKVIEKDKDLRDAARARNEALAEALDEEDAVLVTRANHLADELGMRDCGTNSAF